MHDLITEGYIRRIERACREQRPRAALAIRLAVREAGCADRDRALDETPRTGGGWLLRWGGERLVTICCWLEHRLGSATVPSA
jgi:hypothetical protein